MWPAARTLSPLENGGKFPEMAKKQIVVYVRYARKWRKAL
jgi:hypothetical protein